MEMSFLGGRFRSALVLASVLALAPEPRLASGAQENPEPAGTEDTERPRPLWLSGFFTLLEDHKSIWTSPFRADRRTLPWLLPLAAATSAAIPFDTRIAAGLPNTQGQISAGLAVSHAGNYYALGGAAASFYLGGRLAGNGRARETGLIAAQALLHTHAVTQLLKFATGRERPDFGEGQGRFWQRQQSFPSGHSSGTWAMAAVISREYHDYPWLRYGIYALPLLTNAARTSARRHFLSDSIAGAAIGHLIGNYLYDKHHDSARGGSSARQRRRALPVPEPLCNPASGSYGLTLAWHL
jgi:membrane-associated phospholipid phosphatase